MSKYPEITDPYDKDQIQSLATEIIDKLIDLEGNEPVINIVTTLIEDVKEEEVPAWAEEFQSIQAELEYDEGV